MAILIGFNLLILIIGIFASGKFGALAKSKGYTSAKAVKYPYFIAAGAFFFNILGQTLMSFGSQAMMTLLFFCWGSFIVLVLVTILLKAYKNMQAAPNAKQPTTEEIK